MCKLCEHYYDNKNEQSTNIPAIWICDEINQPTTADLGIGLLVDENKDMFDDKAEAWFEAYDYFKTIDDNVLNTSTLNSIRFYEMLKNHFIHLRSKYEYAYTNKTIQDVDVKENVTNDITKPRFQLNFHYKTVESAEIDLKQNMSWYKKLYTWFVNPTFTILKRQKPEDLRMHSQSLSKGDLKKFEVDLRNEMESLKKENKEQEQHKQALSNYF